KRWFHATASLARRERHSLPPMARRHQARGTGTLHGSEAPGAGDCRLTLFNGLRHNRRVTNISRLDRPAALRTSKLEVRAVIALDRNAEAAGRLWQLSRIVLCVIVLLASLVPLGVWAQAPGGEDTASLEAQKDALFQQMLRDPANLDVTFK